MRGANFITSQLSFVFKLFEASLWRLLSNFLTFFVRVVNLGGMLGIAIEADPVNMSN